MLRRDLLKTPLLAMLPVPAAQDSSVIDRLRSFRITRIVGFRHVGKRPKMVGKNSHLDNHGSTTSDSVIRISTDQGVEGFGVGNPVPGLARQMIGKTLDELWRPRLGVVSPLGRSDHALYDLIGKALGLPAYSLLGNSGPEWVPVYDGSIYFNDLLPEHKDRGVGRLVEEVEQSLKNGHRAFKIKVGRGFKWMEPEAGFKRDVEVVQAIRKAVGKDVKLMVDANNGFDLASTRRWLDGVDDDLFFVEEMFPEDVIQDRSLKDYLRSKGWKTRVADGESAGDIDDLESLISQEAIDVFQPDIRGWGLTRQAVLARKLAIHPALKLAPHNWGSFLGLSMQLVLARSLPNFLIAEQDTSTSDLFDTSAFEFKEGKIRVPEVPGCGLALRENVFKANYEKDAWVVE